MQGIFNTISLGGHDVLAPNNFTPERQDIYAAEYTTMSGKQIADLVGWRYADLTLEWDTLPQSQLEILLGLSGSFDIVFDDIHGSVTERVYPLGTVAVGTRLTRNGDTVWKDVRFSLRFVNAHAYTG